MYLSKTYFYIKYKIIQEPKYLGVYGSLLSMAYFISQWYTVLFMTYV